MEKQIAHHNLNLRQTHQKFSFPPKISSHFYFLKLFFFILFYGLFIQPHQGQTTDTVKLQTVVITDTSEKAALSQKINTNHPRIILLYDAGTILKNIEGFSGIRRGGSNIDPVYRGLKNNQLNYIVDDIAKIEGGCPNRMDPALSHLEPEELTGMDIYRGSPALQFFSSTHGIINMKTLNPQFSDSFKITGHGGTFYESNTNGQKQYLHIGTSSKKLYTKAFGTYKKYGNYQDGKYRTIPSSFTKYSYTAQLAYQLNKNFLFEGTYRESHSNDVLFPALPMDEDKDDTRMTYAKLHWKSNLRWWESSTVAAYHTTVFHQMSNKFRDNYKHPTMPMRAITKVDAYNYGGQWKNEFIINPEKKIFGQLLLDWETIEKSGERNMVMIMNMPGMPYSETKKTTNLWKDALIQNLAVFSALEKKLNNWKIKLFARITNNNAQSEDTLKISKNGIDYFLNTKTSYLTADAGILIGFNINSKITNLLNLGKYSRFPDMNERYIKLLPIGFDQFDYLGNPQLKPESNYQIENSIIFQPNKNDMMQFNIFFTQIQNYIHSKLLPPAVVKPLSMNVAGVKQFYNAKTANFTGGEMIIKKQLMKNFSATLQMQYVYAYLTETPMILFSGKQAIGDTILKNDPLPEIPPFETKLNLEITCFKNLFLNLQTRYIAPQTNTSKAYYEAANPDFTLFDAVVNYTINANIVLYAACQNIFNTAYYEHLNRRIIGSTQKLYEPGRNCIIGLRCKF